MIHMLLKERFRETPLPIEAFFHQCKYAYTDGLSSIDVFLLLFSSLALIKEKKSTEFTILSLAPVSLIQVECVVLYDDKLWRFP